MVRKIGSNTPSIDPPQMYDISGEMYAQMGQSVQQAFASSSQALSNLNTAYAANAQRQMSYLAEQEELKAAQAKASQIGQGGGGIIQGIGEVAKGLIGGFAVQEELKQRRAQQDLQREQFAQQKYEFTTQMQMRKEQQAAELELAGQKMAQEQEQFAYEQQMKEGEAIIDSVVSQLGAQLEGNIIGMTADQGIAYTSQQIEAVREQYKSVFEQNPTLASMFDTKVYGIQQDIYRYYGKEYRGEIQAERKLTVENMNQYVTMTFATRWEEMRASAGLWTAEQANASLNNLIQESTAQAMNDPRFAAAVQADPGLMGTFYKNLFAHAKEMYGEFAQKNAQLNATVSKVDQVNNLFAQNIDVNDPGVVAMLQHEFARLGLDYQDPTKWATSYNQTVIREAQMVETSEKLAAAVQVQDPMFGMDTPEQRIVLNYSKAKLVYDAYNRKEGQDISNAKSWVAAELRAARERGDISAEKYWDGHDEFLKDFEKAYNQYQDLGKQRLQAEQELAAALKPADPTKVVTDAMGRPVRETIGGQAAMPKYTPEEIEALKKRAADLRVQQETLQKQWFASGLNLANMSDRSALDPMAAGAEPYMQQLNQRLMQQGVVVDPQQKARERSAQPSPYVPPDNRQSTAPVNFSGGSVSNAQVVGGQTGTLPFQTTPVPQANAVPFQGGIATMPQVGFVPFKGGTVTAVSKPEAEGLVIKSTDPRAAAVMGGQVVYAGGTQTLGNVVVIQTKDGRAEVYAGLDSVAVKPGEFIKPGVFVGKADQLEFQVWQTKDALKALRLEIPRNEVNPVAYLQGISGYRKAPDGLGTVDILSNKPRPVGGGTTNVWAGDDYTIFGTILVTKDGKQRNLTPKEMKVLYPNGMPNAVIKQQKEQNAYINQPIQLPSQNVPPPKYNKQGQMVFNSNDFNHVDKTKFVFPMQGNITGDQGTRHRGVDIFAPVGAQIVSPFAGTIVYSIADTAMTNKYGSSVPGKNVPQHSIKIKLDNPIQYKGKTIRYVFLTHLSSTESLAKGQHVNAGDLLGKNGHANAPHLHLGFSETEAVGGNRPISNGETLDLLNQLRVGGGTINMVTDKASRQQQGTSDPTRRRDSFAEINQQNRDVTRGLLDDPQALANIRAFADIIAYSEGHGRPVQYNTTLGWGTFDTSRPHPGSKAHGRYQFIGGTWRGLWGNQNLAMTPYRQDLGFIMLLQRRNAYEDVLAGNFEKAFQKVANEWVSVKGATYAEGARQGKFTPQELAKRARTAAQSYMKGDANLADQRTPVTNAPLAQVQATRTTPSAYGKPNPNANFGYPVLAQNTYLRKTIYNVAVQTGRPMQQIADIVAQQTNNFTKIQGLDLAGVQRMVAVNTTPNRSQSQYQPISPINVVPQRTAVNRSYTQRKRKKEWHFSKRSNCPTCQAMPIFLPHYINVEV